MSKQKMLTAREFIKEKRYDEARLILETVDHPTAREWLARLDEIAPPLPDVDLPDIVDAAPAPERPKGYNPGVRQPLFWIRVRFYFALIMVLLLILWLAFGVLVGASIRDAVVQLGEQVSGLTSPGADVNLSNLPIEGLEDITDDVALQISEFVNDLGVVEGFDASTVQNVDFDDVTSSLSTAALGMVFVSFFCPVLPLLLSFSWMAWRNWRALRQGRRVNRQLKLAARQLGG